MGCGAVAMYGHLPAIRDAKDLELWAIYDPFESNLRAAQSEFGSPQAFTDARAFFESGIEAVTITSPAPCHLDNVLDAARYRLPVLCEKPLAMTGEEAERMIAAMRAADVPLYTAFCYRFSRSALKIRELVQHGAIGTVRSLRLIYNWNVHGQYEIDAHGESILRLRRHDRMLEGGPMVDCGTHQIDLAQFWLNSEVVHYTGVGAWVEEYEAPDHMWLHLDHANGAHTTVEISYSYHHTTPVKRNEFVYELIGTEGVIRYDREAASFVMNNASGAHKLDFYPEKEFLGLYDAFAAALRDGHSELLTSAESGQRVTEIAREATNQAIAHRRKLCPTWDSCRKV